MPKGFRLDKAVADAAVEAVVEGLSYRQAAARWGISAPAVARAVRARGLVGLVVSVGGRPRVADEVLVPAWEAIAAGMSLEAAGALVGVSGSTLSRRRTEQGGGVLHPRKYRPTGLRLAEREEIRVGIEAGLTDAEIARGLGRHRGTIGREIKANGGRARYRAHLGERRAAGAARRPQQYWTQTRPQLWEQVQQLIKTKKWSPAQMAGWLRLEYPDQPQWWVSHESIYQAVYVQTKGQLRKELAACLRTGRSRRRPQGRTSGGSKIIGMINISARPPEAADRAIPGHWESQCCCQAA